MKFRIGQEEDVRMLAKYYPAAKDFNGIVDEIEKSLNLPAERNFKRKIYQTSKSIFNVSFENEFCIGAKFKFSVTTKKIKRLL